MKKKGLIFFNPKGQTLLEVIIAIGVILTGVVSTVALAIYSMSVGQVSENQIIGSNLAREGIEVIRNIRDTNWLKIEANQLDPDRWDEGETSGFPNLVLADPPNNAGIVFFGPGGNSPYEYHAWRFDNQPRATQFSGESPNVSFQIYLDTFDPNKILYRQQRGGFSGSNYIPTNFYRMIRVDEICDDGSIKTGDDPSGGTGTCNGVSLETIGLRILSYVKWWEKNRWEEVKMEDRIYNWKPGTVN